MATLNSPWIWAPISVLLGLGGMIAPGPKARLHVVQAPCSSPDADPWVKELRGRMTESDGLVSYARDLVGPLQSCVGAVETEYDGLKFGFLRLGFADEVMVDLRTMPPEVSVVTLRVPSGFEDESAAREVLRAYAAKVGVDIDWDVPVETREGEDRVVSFWDPDPGLNAQAALIYTGDVLVALRFSLAP